MGAAQVCLLAGSLSRTVHPLCRVRTLDPIGTHTVVRCADSTAAFPIVTVASTAPARGASAGST